MIARTSIHLQFPLWILPSDQLKPMMTTVGELGVTVHPPVPDTSVVSVATVQVDDEQAVLCGAIVVDVHGEFDRRIESDHAHLVDTGFAVAAEFMARLRVLSLAAAMKPLQRSGTSWRLDFFRDDGSSFEMDPTLVRGRASLWSSPGTFTYVSPEAWQQAFSPTAIPPTADLILDAIAALPHVGSALTLAATAIEVRVSTALEILAPLRTDVVSPEFWSWVNDRRNDHKRQPAVDEELRELLALFTGHDLHERADLWKFFTDLRQARNRFAHEGVASIGGKLVDVERAGGLIDGARQIIDWIESFLPAQFRRPTLVVERKLSVMIPLGGVSAGGA